MMKKKIENQEQFEKAVKQFEEDYINDYKEAKEEALNLESFYIKRENNYNFKMDSLQEKFPINEASIFIQKWQFDNNSKKNVKTEFEIIALFCEKNKYDLQSIAWALAEFRSVKKIFGDLLKKERSQDQIANKKVPDESQVNIFCHEMPLNIAVEHFKIFTETESKNEKPFLSTDQFNSFVDKAFKGKKDVKKETFNLTNREKLFVIKRFYEFYLLASNGQSAYEKTAQCQTKYIKLISDNFTNWTYENLKNNFGNKVKREW